MIKWVEDSKVPNEGEEAFVWQKELEWMRRKTDYIDPFVNRKDELLDKKDIEKLINPKIIKTSESESSYDYYNSSPKYSYWQIKKYVAQIEKKSIARQMQDHAFINGYLNFTVDANVFAILGKSYYL